jgi:hypothetical protein
LLQHLKLLLKSVPVGNVQGQGLLEFGEQLTRPRGSVSLGIPFKFPKNLLLPDYTLLAFSNMPFGFGEMSLERCVVHLPRHPVHGPK